MAVSRSPIAFLERKGVHTTLRHPVPRLDLVRIRVRDLPVEDPVPNPAAFLDAQGSPPPDVGNTGPWPPPREVSADEST